MRPSKPKPPGGQSKNGPRKIASSRATGTEPLRKEAERLWAEADRQAQRKSRRKTGRRKREARAS